MLYEKSAVKLHGNEQVNVNWKDLPTSQLTMTLSHNLMTNNGHPSALPRKAHLIE